MHYGAWFFNRNDGKQTIEVLHPERPCGNANDIGQKNGLSPGDIAAVNEIYLNIAPTVIRNPHGILELFMVGSDRQLYHSWETAAGSSSSGWVGSWAPLGGRFP